jgi:hypothetical protein
MTIEVPSPMPPPPTLATLGRTTAVALVVAAIILVTTVLPAEYAIDPLGTGRWLGLTEIASPTVDAVEMTRSPGAPLKPLQTGRVATYPGTFSYDVYEVRLEPFEYVEYKYQLEQDATMMFSWTATAAVTQDFHGDRATVGDGEAAEESYDKEDRQGADGAFTAPFAGIHGWFWENPNADPVTVRLTTSGFYSGAVEIRSDRTRTARAIRALDTLTAAVPPAAPVTKP